MPFPSCSQLPAATVAKRKERGYRFANGGDEEAIVIETEGACGEPVKMAYEAPQIAARVDITAGLVPAISGSLGPG
jgi:hypothetical protein